MIKPIETRYKGYRFRSRLEARWAVFFDCMRFSWEYEPEGFILDDGTHYLPDFRVKTPQGKDIWYEVKRGDVLNDEKFRSFYRDGLIHQNDEGSDVFRAELLSGDPVEHLSRKTLSKNGNIKENKICPRCGLIGDPAYGYDVDAWDEYYFGCLPCDLETPTGSGNAEEKGILNCWVTPTKGHLVLETSEYLEKIEPLIAHSAIAARSARFEHGEHHA